MSWYYAGGTSPYLVFQNFETPTTGYDNGETWVPSGTINPAYTTSPIVGAQSCLLNSNYASITTPNFAAADECWAYFRAKPTNQYWTGASAGERMFGFRNSGGTHICQINLAYQNAPPERSVVKLYTNGSLSTASSTYLATYSSWHFWLHYVRNGTCELFGSQNGIRPTSDGSGTIYLTKTGGNTQAVNFQLQRIDYPILVDRVIVSLSAIGNNP